MKLIIMVYFNETYFNIIQYNMKSMGAKKKNPKQTIPIINKKQ